LKEGRPPLIVVIVARQIDNDLCDGGIRIVFKAIYRAAADNGGGGRVKSPLERRQPFYLWLTIIVRERDKSAARVCDAEIARRRRTPVVLSKIA
jgi:hypothetical protein